MIIKTASPENSDFSSHYGSSLVPFGEGTLCVLGGDPALRAEVSAKVAAPGWALTPEKVRDLYLELPGHYSVVYSDRRRAVFVTDPYGIIKLYSAADRGGLVVCDDPLVLKDSRFTLDVQAVKYFLVSKYTPANHTFFRELSKLEPCAFYTCEPGKPAEKTCYGRFGAASLGGEAFLESFYGALRDTLLSCRRRYARSALFLSGGLDSSFLYGQLAREGMKDWTAPLIGQPCGLGQSRRIDSDYDLDYSVRLAAGHGQKVAVSEYDLASPKVLEDFLFLRDRLFTEYSLAVGYMGYARAVDRETLILNGQNADSLLSFGSTGHPRLAGGRIKGLNGYFSRFSFFFGEHGGAALPRGLAHLLRRIYYGRLPDSRRPEFTEKNGLLGIGLHPDNSCYSPADPVFFQIEDPDGMAAWFSREYLVPLRDGHPALGHYARSVLLYNRTYMQGSANRATVLSSMLQGRAIFLPYTSLSLLELMSNLRPDWGYAFYGKFPNMELGRRRLGLPEYILDRCDPDDSDSTSLTYDALLRNKAFGEFVADSLRGVDWARYEGVLSAGALAELKKNGLQFDAGTAPLALKLIWLDTTLSKFSCG